jgi:hypothetical protein
MVKNRESIIASARTSGWQIAISAANLRDFCGLIAVSSIPGFAGTALAYQAAA